MSAREPVCFVCDEPAKRAALVERRDGEAVAHYHRACLAWRREQDSRPVTRSTFQPGQRKPPRPGEKPPRRSAQTSKAAPLPAPVVAIGEQRELFQ